MYRSKIIGIGAYNPAIIETNFEKQNIEFIRKDSTKFKKSTSDIISKFEDITEITQRTLAAPEILASDMGYFASVSAIEDGNIDKESLDYIIVAHNWGDNYCHNNHYDILPNLATRIKNKLDIRNPNCVAYDILFGCPGWVEAVKQADILIRAKEAKKVLVVGTDSASRVVEKCDIDSMLFSDGAGAIVLEGTFGENGVLGHKSMSHCNEEIGYLKMDKAYDIENGDSNLYLKMIGKSVFKYAMMNVPEIIATCLSNANISIDDVQYFLIHQANGKMIKLIAKKLFENFGEEYDKSKVPIIVGRMGNNGAATVPTLLFELSNKKINDRGILKNDILVFASVGAGMHANCVVYKF